MHSTDPIHGGLTAAEIIDRSDPGAVARYQACIDAIKRDFWDRDWDALVAHIAVPNRMTAQDTARVFETRAEWRAVAQATRAGFADNGISEYHRICRGAFFIGGDRRTILGVHETYILRGSAFVVPPYHGYMRLVRGAERWMSEGLHSDLRDTLLPTIHADRLVPDERA